MAILAATINGIAVWCLVVASALPAVAAELPSCYGPQGSNLDIASMKTHTIIPYPVSSIRHHEQGTTGVLVTVATDGTPTDVTIRRISGSQRLDDAAADHIKTHWRWPPSQGCQQAVTVIWNLMGEGAFLPSPDFHVEMPLSAYPAGSLANMENGSTLLEIETDGQGAIAGGQVINTSGFRDLDAQALAIVRNSPALMKGQPTGKHILSADWDAPTGVHSSDTETVIVTGRLP